MSTDVGFAFVEAALRGGEPRATGDCLAGPEILYPLDGMATGASPIGVRWCCALCGRTGQPQYGPSRLMSRLALFAEVAFFDRTKGGYDCEMWLGTDGADADNEPGWLKS